MESKRIGDLNGSRPIPYQTIIQQRTHKRVFNAPGKNMVTDLFEIIEPREGTQQYEILHYLRRGYKLTPLDGLRLAKTFKISSRVGELIKLGHPIKSEWVKLENGKKVKRYYLDK